MVLVESRVTAVRRSERRVGAAPAAASRPAARNQMLTLLREGSGHRPSVDPGLAGGLRAWLEDAAGELSCARGESASPLFLGPRTLLAAPAPAAWEGRADPFSLELATSSLVRALFRQLVIAGSVGDPLTDGLDALRVDPARAELVSFIETLGTTRRAELADTVGIHLAHVADITPRFSPGWLPRTGDRVAIPLAGGRVVLSGVFDLLVGAPVPGTASVCAIGLTTSGRWARGRMTLHYLSLLETLRNGAPPFRLALVHSGAGRYAVEDVREEHLRALVAHLAAHLTALAQDRA